ncbi:MAG: (d)CMP kinase [Lachnospiraceae bacterium]|nr:(d)CMP kinase [Candidatus Minthocola equi]
MNKNIALDGPAGAGKSTIAKALAAKLGLVYVDTGAMYRGLAIHFLRNNLAPDDETGISEAVKSADVSIKYEDGVQQVYLNGENITSILRDEEVGKMASASSVYTAVRTRLVALQQELARTTAVVMDGRDIGTVVLPDAGLKVFVTASVEERTDRRVRQLIEQGVTPDVEQIRKDIEERDYRDTHRENSPLKAADDAIIFDNTGYKLEQSVEYVYNLYKEKCLK